MVFKTFSIFLSVGGFKLKNITFFPFCISISLLSNLFIKEFYLSYESPKVNIISGVYLSENTIASKAWLKSLTNSNFRGLKIFKHSKNPLITRILLVLSITFDFSSSSVFFLADSLLHANPLLLIVLLLALPDAWELIVMKFMRFSNSDG